MPKKKKDDDQVREGAQAMAKRGASRGGKARAERLTPSERSDIARRAAAARWGSDVVQASHVGTMQIADQEIACAVVDGGVRLINQGTLLTALGRNRRPKSAGGATVLFAANLQPFISPDLEAALRESITYVTPTGGRALGFKAELLPQVCEVYLDARAAGKLLKSQTNAGHAADILMRGLARVGVVALVDEATGYQEVRARQELQRILEAYVQAELRPWMKTFPDEFFREIYRLQGWDYRPGTSKRTPYVGVLVNKYVYAQLPPGVLDELRSLNPRNEHGNRPRRFHQFLTADTGNAHLDRQISTVTTLMRIARDKQDFEDLFERAFPPTQPRLPLVIHDDDDEAEAG
jgi:hypothetical protein